MYPVATPSPVSVIPPEVHRHFGKQLFLHVYRLVLGQTYERYFSSHALHLLQGAAAPDSESVAGGMQLCTIARRLSNLSVYSIAYIVEVFNQ